MITFVSVGYASLSVSRQSSTAALGIGDKEALLETGGDDPSMSNRIARRVRLDIALRENLSNINSTA
jgi:hypothetical protein